jgi:signal transduction histidine kinase/CheY-like chemotaxis protein
VSSVTGGTEAERRRRFRTSVQRTRLLSYLLAGLLGVAFALLGVQHYTLPRVVTLCGAAALSAVLLYLVARARLDDRWPRLFDAAWLLLDALIITAAVAITGGAASPWFLWYLANIAGAAFVLGALGALVVFLLDTGLYLALLVALGVIDGFNLALYQPLTNMVFLYAASFLFLRGVQLLQQRNALIERMRNEETRQVEELTRLTTALDQRNREIADASLRIREADRLKSQFLANMSHELRTPLNSIIGFSDVLLSRLPESFPEKQRKFLENINASGQHLLSIINDLLDLSKIEAGKMELQPEPLVVGPLIEGVCTIVRGTAKSRNMRFALSCPEDLPLLEADPVKLKQILFNLISNAVKFSDDGATVEVDVRSVGVDSSPLDCEAVQVAVIDRGVGIDPRNHRLIFEEFRQVDQSATRAHGGTGLGLALVRRLIELHRGTITVESAPGQGSTFTVTMPRRFAGTGESVRPAPETLDLPAESGRRILVVEDDPTAYDTISRHLTAAAYIPVRARNSDEAMRLAHQLEPAAITLDIILPGADGWEILRLLKADPSTRAIPVIIVSMLDNRELAITLGADDYLVKPVDGESLVQRLIELVPVSPTHRRRLLLIDDDPSLHELVDAKLEPLGYEVAHALSGRDGIEAAQSRVPDLILLDLMMEGMDGFEVATRLKTHSLTAATPVVVLTAKGITRVDRERLRGKIEALVGKSDMPSGRLVAVIEGVLAGQHQGRKRA